MDDDDEDVLVIDQIGPTLLMVVGQVDVILVRHLFLFDNVLS